MRWKLLIVASVLAALIGAGACIAAANLLLNPARHISSGGWIALATVLIPLAAVTYSAIFVYRHTARHRTLQAMATVLLASLLTLTALLVGSILSGKPAPEIFPPSVPNFRAS